MWLRLTGKAGELTLVNMDSMAHVEPGEDGGSEIIPDIHSNVCIRVLEDVDQIFTALGGMDCPEHPGAHYSEDMIDE